MVVFWQSHIHTFTGIFKTVEVCDCSDAIDSREMLSVALPISSTHVMIFYSVSEIQVHKMGKIINTKHYYFTNAWKIGT